MSLENYNPLISAVVKDDLDNVKKIIDSKSEDVDFVSKLSGLTSFLIASSKGNIDILKY